MKRERERETEGYGDSKMMAVLVWTVNILDKDFWIFFLVRVGFAFVFVEVNYQ